jgi:hypothetical protein
MRHIILLIAVLAGAGSLAARPTWPDTVAAVRDTTRRDSLDAKKDSSANSGGIDTLVNYSSRDSIVYDLSSKTMSLYANGEISYKDMKLRSERIDINWNNSEMSAVGVKDTADSTGKKIRGSPIMKEGSEEYHGSQLGYNFKSKKGKIVVANTTIDQGYYHGDAIKKIDKDLLFIEDGRYTTCDAPEPHYYFYSPKMKVTPGDKIIGEPIYLYIADVPVFALPFGVFPNQRGRRSGIIAPAYGEDANRGKYLAHLGYYFALSDYMDLALHTDLYSKGGYAAASSYRYNLRDNFNGSLGLQYQKLHTGEENDPDRTEDESYRATLTHFQNIDPATQASANFTFTSNNSYRLTNDLNSALNQNIISNASISHIFDENNSAALSITRNQNLQNGNLYNTLPSFSFNHSSTYPFRWGKKESSEEDLSWYEKISFNYGLQASNSTSKTQVNIDSIKQSVGGRDTIGRVQEYARQKSQSVTQHIDFNFAPKVGYITIAPFLNYADSRNFTEEDYPVLNRSDSSIATSTRNTADRSGVIQSGVSVSSRLYGIVQPNLLGVAAIRHTVTPSLTLTYSKKVIGDDPFGKQMFLTLGIGNLLEMKTNPTEEGKEGSKIQLLNFNAGLSYNFSQDSLRFSEIRANYNTKITSILDLSGSASFNLYQLDPNNYRTLNKFLITEEGRLARLTSFNIGLSTSFSGERKSSGAATSDSTPVRHRLPGMSYNPYEQEDPDFNIPWNLSFSLNFAETKVPPFPTRSVNMNGHLDFNLTPAWKFSFQTSYDVTSREFIAPQIDISRDLHCWILNFTWSPIGAYRHYQLEIRVKAPSLRDLKVSKSGSDRGIY